jgi:hypothetical protein
MSSAELYVKTWEGKGYMSAGIAVYLAALKD